MLLCCACGTWAKLFSLVSWFSSTSDSTEILIKFNLTWDAPPGPRHTLASLHCFSPWIVLFNQVLFESSESFSRKKVHFSFLKYTKVGFKLIGRRDPAFNEKWEISNEIFLPTIFHPFAKEIYIAQQCGCPFFLTLTFSSRAGISWSRWLRTLLEKNLIIES